MALSATSLIVFVAAACSRLERTIRPTVPRRGRAATFAALTAALLLCGAATRAVADGTAAPQAAATADEERTVTIVLRAPFRFVGGDRVTLHSMLRFSGRATEDARIEILANGIVVARTVARHGGFWYAPRTRIAAGRYEFAARAVAPDGTRELSGALRVRVSPPVLIDPEALAGKSVYSVGSLQRPAPASSTTPG